MVSVDGTTITMTRGDTLLLKIKPVSPVVEDNVVVGYVDYIPVSGDQFRFAMKEKFGDDTEVLVKKTIPNNTLLLELEPADTKSLDMTKKYVYDIQLTTASGRVDTFINRASIQFTEEVD